MPETPTHVVVGATGGIGSALCHELAARGPCNLLLAARDGARLGQLAAELQVEHRTPPAVACHALDAQSTGAVEEAFGAAAKAFGKLPTGR